MKQSCAGKSLRQKDRDHIAAELPETLSSCDFKGLRMVKITPENGQKLPETLAARAATASRDVRTRVGANGESKNDIMNSAPKNWASRQYHFLN
ncbi:hypothetical protein FHP25_16085 [Vineibacter terrae]|uniref:Uncharacterized protein n=1 Tax=Vineibacter terrae TaxID=2586908 RepID=A0A5C8PKY7_9HYPH|nr:hypothetical protein [Vineibacter terrae]TXL74601.1 hypothetical protein FHP25_16085 [Vineibacter terrae]